MDYFVYALEHIYTDEIHTVCKFLGYFDNLEKLQEAKEKALTLSGFSEYADGLIVKKYRLGKIHWENGFQNIIGEVGRDYLPEDDILDEDIKSIKELGLIHVFQVSHIYTIDTFLDDERIIGVFLDENTANKVADNLKLEKGFIDHQEDFIIGRFTLNNQLWTSGF
ncbi:hypothetical protein BA768_17665 [Chryseobacterium sp. CBo1]|uniref:hypothetical protein n=1 Tax=Chryseobacterium sp. CBo1 TaxID=1869230 RepID=UPI000810BDF1|nr:hypothetical protein [Chryseobacterium sp. CBo1]OCK51170.1 hypothetical protein BA768_17665 [Chryseobacterium sp. CBo1]